jgi:hypothetical protein
MAKLEEITEGVSIEGVVADRPVTVVHVKWFGGHALELTYKIEQTGTIGHEVVQHLQAILGADVKITLDIEADIPDGVPDQIVRIISENARTLRFESFGFEE